MSVHENSVQAYLEELPRLSQRAEAIMVYIRGYGKPLTDRQIMQGMRFADMNCVRPRVTELVKRGLLYEVDSIKCDVTNKQVRRVTL